MRQQTQINKIEWKEVELGNISLFEITMGQSPSGESYNIEGIGTPFFQGKAEFGKKYPSVRKWTTQPSKLAKSGDILMSVRAPVGSINMADINCCIGRGLASIRCKQGLQNDFVYYFLKLNEVKIERLGTGSTFKAITSKQLLNIKIPLPFFNGKPDLEEQERIVKILEKAEKQKERGKNTNDLLGEYLKSVFNEMFCNKGFEEKSIKELCDVISGSTPSTTKEEYWNGKINWITPAELIDGDNYYYYESQRKITSQGLDSASTLFPKDTVMLTTRAPIGKVAIAGKEMCTNQGFKNMICKKELNPIYLYFWLLFHKDYLNSLGVGATFKEISKKIVENIKIPVPPFPLQQKFTDIVEQVEKMKEKVKKTSQNSEDLFNSLMQKAFRGDL